MRSSTNSASVNISAQAAAIAIRRQTAIFLIIEFLRTLGIVRWLFAMPVLATAIVFLRKKA